jgi:hypothetical protein
MLKIMEITDLFRTRSRGKCAFEERLLNWRSLNLLMLTCEHDNETTGKKRSIHNCRSSVRRRQSKLSWTRRRLMVWVLRYIIQLPRHGHIQWFWSKAGRKSHYIEFYESDELTALIDAQTLNLTSRSLTSNAFQNSNIQITSCTTNSVLNFPESIWGGNLRL